MYTLIKVSSRRQAQAFRRFAKPLGSEVENLFSAEKNPLLQEGGEAVRFMLEDENGSTVGRIAAFVRPAEPPTGYVDFLEYQDKQEVKEKLLDVCRQWVEVRGVGSLQVAATVICQNSR
jgi:hypothetical protein